MVEIARFGVSCWYGELRLASDSAILPVVAVVVVVDVVRTDGAVVVVRSL